MKRFVAWGIALIAVIAAVPVAVTLIGAGAASDASAATPPQQIGLKVLLVSDGANCAAANPSADEIAYCDWVTTLKREGVPYATWDTSTATAPTLWTTVGGTQVANYSGVIVSLSGLDGLTAAQYTALQTFEQKFNVRQLTAYAVLVDTASKPLGPDYGLSSTFTTFSGSPSPTLTAAGQSVFPYLKKVDFDAGTFGYEAAPAPTTGTTVQTLISGPGNSSLLGIYTSKDGRQTMYQTFNENQYMLQSELLRHGELNWVTRGTYFGDQRNYMETDIDDNFLADDVWSIAGNATTAPHSTDYTPADALREVPADVSTAATWSRANHFRIDMLFNGGGSVAQAEDCQEATSGDGGGGGGTTTSPGCSSTVGVDPLLQQFQSNDPATGKPYTGDFYWINHTWDHPNLDEGCATTNYIEAEINQNTAWGAKPAAGGNPSTGGLGLTDSNTATDALGNEQPGAVITGEHSGLANLIPGNPGQVDPPALDSAAAGTAAGTLPAGEYVYAVADQFNTAAPGATPVAGTGESAASVSAPVTVTGTTDVELSWGAVCKAADYIVYRAPYTAPVPPATTGTIGAWSEIGTVAADTTADFPDPSSTTNTAGGGATPKTFSDTGITGTLTGTSGDPGTTGEPASEGTAVESAYEQNPNLDAAFSAAGITEFGTDASKPYPATADATFATGSAPAAQVAAGGTFQDAGGTAIPRYPTNIYYNVSTNAEEVDEYETLYDDPTCTPLAGVTTCNPAGTAFTIAQIVASVDQGMFQHLMGNDPRPDYFHQTNLMSQTTGSPTGEGDGLYYETMNPLLAEYNEYFAANAPIEQDTMAQIATLLSEQSSWLAAEPGNGTDRVTASIPAGSKVITIDNSGTAIMMPLTGTTVGSLYGGTQSGWVSAPAGTSTETALTAWPSPPAVAVIPTVPTGTAAPGSTGRMPSAAKPPATPSGPQPPAPSSRPKRRGAIYYHAVQVAPRKVKIRHGKVRVSLKCVASRGRTVRGRTCKGSLTLAVAGRRIHHRFKIKSARVDRIAVKLPRVVQAATRTSRHHRIRCALTISTRRPHARPRLAHGELTVRR